jgi:hypothetical protein
MKRIYGQADYVAERATSTEDRAELLEALVDRYGLRQVLELLTRVCGDKEEHLRGNWGDESYARGYSQAAEALEKAAEDIKRILG